MSDIDILKSKITMPDLLTKLGYQVVNDKAICFVHGDTKPSLSFNDEVWYCFGCSQGGDKIKLIEHTKKYSFIEAIAYLSDLTGYQLHQVKKKSFNPVDGVAKMIKQVNNIDYKLIYINDSIKSNESLYGAWTQAAYANRKDTATFDLIENKLETISANLIYWKQTRKKHCQQKNK